MLRRYLDAAVRADLGAKMVFVAGPRQVGAAGAKDALTPEGTLVC